jgi:hypothetical protein
MTKKNFDNAKKTHRVAIATKTRDQTGGGNSSIPTTTSPKDRLAAVQAAVKTRKDRTHDRPQGSRRCTQSDDRIRG